MDAQKTKIIQDKLRQIEEDLSDEERTMVLREVNNLVMELNHEIEEYLKKMKALSATS